jgi:predicted TIM-barrel fold metal-dependent hydrolase
MFADFIRTPNAGGKVPRRGFLAGLAALGAAALIPEAWPAAQREAARTGQSPLGPRPFRIDTHHHFSVPGQVAELIARKTGQTPLIEWTPQKSIEDMDKGGVATAIVSISEPSVWFGDDAAARKLARECNDYGAKLVRDFPGRFGFFATVPLPDVDGTLSEMAYALDTLQADGVCVMSSYAGKYLGDPAFVPVMDELNRRKAVVYCHPFRAPCCQNLLPQGSGLGGELVNDTTRTITSVLYSATVERCPDVRFIWSHGGGTVPYITGRLSGASRVLPKGLIYELQKFYYDTAQTANPYTLPSFKKLVPASHILFGSDFPFFSGSAATAQGLIDNGGFTASELRAIDRDNALELFPRLKR